MKGGKHQCSANVLDVETDSLGRVKKRIPRERLTARNRGGGGGAKEGKRAKNVAFFLICPRPFPSPAPFPLVFQ